MKHKNHPQSEFKQNSNQANYYITSNMNDWSLVRKNNLWRPPTDVYETPDQFIVTIEIAGMDEGSITILFENSMLSIQGKRNIRSECSVFHQIEINCGEFLSTVGFTVPIHENEIKTKYLNGLLHINLPKLNQKKQESE